MNSRGPAGCFISRSRRSARVPDKKVAAAALGRHHPGSPHFIALRRVVLLLCARIARGSNLFPTARGVRALRGRKPSPLWRPGIFPFRRWAAAFLRFD